MYECFSHAKLFPKGFSKEYYEKLSEFVVDSKLSQLKILFKKYSNYFFYLFFDSLYFLANFKLNRMISIDSKDRPSSKKTLEVIFFI